MTITVSITEAATNLKQLLERVGNGDIVLILEAGQPLARLVPVIKTKLTRRAGGAAGRIQIAPDFDAPLPEAILQSFEN